MGHNVSHDEGKTISIYSSCFFTNNFFFLSPTSAYNQILVKETQQFIENHIYERPNDPFFAYVGLGSVHLPHSPPYTYTDGSPIKGVYPSAHMDVLYELDKVVGSLVSTIEDNSLTKDTVIIFTSDNGGLPWDSNFFHHSSGKYIASNRIVFWIELPHSYVSMYFFHK